MPLITGPLKWYTVTSTLVAAIYAELSLKPDRAGVVPGAIAWDECDCGLLAGFVAQVFPSEIFPNPSRVRTGGCDAPIEVAELVFQIVRCAPNPEGEQFAPTVAALDTAAQDWARDAYEMLRAVSVKLCQMVDDQVIDYVVVGETSQGPSGGCVGSEIRVLVALGRN